MVNKQGCYSSSVATIYGYPVAKIKERVLIYSSQDWTLVNGGWYTQRNWKHIQIYTKQSFSDVYGEYTVKYRDGARWQAVYRCIGY